MSLLLQKLLPKRDQTNDKKFGNSSLGGKGAYMVSVRVITKFPASTHEIVRMDVGQYTNARASKWHSVGLASKILRRSASRRLSHPWRPTNHAEQFGGPIP